MFLASSELSFCDCMYAGEKERQLILLVHSLPSPKKEKGWRMSECLTFSFVDRERKWNWDFFPFFRIQLHFQMGGRSKIRETQSRDRRVEWNDGGTSRSGNQWLAGGQEAGKTLPTCILTYFIWLSWFLGSQWYSIYCIYLENTIHEPSSIEKFTKMRGYGPWPGPKIRTGKNKHGRPKDIFVESIG